MGSLKIRMHNSQLDNKDFCGGNPQKMGAENPWPRPITLMLYRKPVLQLCTAHIPIVQVRRTRVG